MYYKLFLNLFHMNFNVINEEKVVVANTISSRFQKKDSWGGVCV